jgi:archaeal cell division control protein 6
MNLLKRLKKGGENRIFTDEMVFSDSYEIERIPCRNAEENKLADLTGGFIQGKAPGFRVFIFGPNGVGKSAVVGYFLRVVGRFVGGKGSYFCPIRVNCRVTHTEMQVYSEIQGQLTGKYGAKRTNLVIKRIADELKKNAKVMVVLDEIDKLDETRESSISRLIENLVEINNQGQPGQLSLICISNRVTLPNKLSPKANRFLTESKIQFNPYNAQQMTKILKDRIKLGLKKGAISDAHTSLIAAYASQTNGDARYGIMLLKAAAKNAESENRLRIQKEDIIKAKIDVEEELIKSLIDGLPEHQHIVLYSIAKLTLTGSNYKRRRDIPKDTLFTGEVYDVYVSACKVLNRNPRTQRWLSEYLKELESYGLITLTISGRGVMGTTTLIRSAVKTEDVYKITSNILGLA